LTSNAPSRRPECLPSERSHRNHSP
jgi:hypothetical protein